EPGQRLGEERRGRGGAGGLGLWGGPGGVAACPSPRFLPPDRGAAAGGEASPRGEMLHTKPGRLSPPDAPVREEVHEGRMRRRFGWKFDLRMSQIDLRETSLDLREASRSLSP